MNPNNADVSHPPHPLLPSTQVSSSTSVALLTETSLSWKHLTDTSIIYRMTFFTIAFKGTKHKLTAHTHTQADTLQLFPQQPLQCFYMKKKKNTVN